MRQTIALALLLLVSCKTQATKAERAREELASWAAAGQMLSDGWAREKTHTPYVKSTVETASDEIESLRQPLQGDTQSLQSLEEVSALYASLAKAVEQGDRHSGEEIARAFGDVNRRLQQQKNASPS